MQGKLVPLNLRTSILCPEGPEKEPLESTASEPCPRFRTGHGKEADHTSMFDLYLTKLWGCWHWAAHSFRNFT